MAMATVRQKAGFRPTTAVI